uniref:Uncharacterized protein n=1 Tax=Vitis vinifera TaxID=29760 RepID=F6HMX5_VITVI
MASLLCCSSFIKKLPVNQGGALSPSCFSLSGPLSLSQNPRPHFYDFCTTPWLHGFEGSKKKFSNFPLCFHLNFLDCFKKGRGFYKFPEVEEGYKRVGRIAMEGIDDYAGTGANTHHDPKPPGRV